MRAQEHLVDNGQAIHTRENRLRDNGRMHPGPVTDPTDLYRLRDGVYAADLLIVAVAELDLFSQLAVNGHATVEQLCAAHGIRPHPADVLVTYLVSLGLLRRDGERVGPTPLAREHFVSGSPYDLRAYYGSLRERPGCRELLSVLRTGEPAGWSSADAGEDWASRLADPEFAERITSAMDARGRFLGPLLADAIADLPIRRVLDVGGSSGIYSAALVDRLPAVRAAVFERSPVDVAARALLAARGYIDKIDVIAGDMFSDALPTDFDVHLYSHVLHDWDQSRVRGLVEASFAALPSGGYFVDHDMHIDREKTGPLSAAEYSVFLMHSTPGKCWSVGELADLLADAGFGEVAERATGGGRSVVLARKP